MSVKLLVCPTWQSTELMLEATLWKNVIAGIVLDVRRPSGRRRSRNGVSSVIVVEPVVGCCLLLQQ